MPAKEKKPNIRRECRFRGLDFASRKAGFFLIFVLISFLLSGEIGAQGVGELKQELSGQLKEIQDKIEIYRGQIKQKRQEITGLSRETGILDAQIGQAELEIEQTDLASQKLEIIISEKEKEINKFVALSDQKKAVLTEYLRTIYEYDQMSLLEIILETQNFSDLFDEIQSLESIQDKIKNELLELKFLQEDLENQKGQLEEKKNQYDGLRRLQEIQKRAYQLQKEKKKALLDQTKGQESLFRKLMDRAHSDISSIKNQLYLLEGVGLSMTLEDALKHAEYASIKTGVRPAFLLAVLKQESSWGTNVGTGYWRSDMHSRDHGAYLKICKKLGLEPDKMPVSRKPSYGWGGAIGPAQFLPSTWLALEPEIARLTGHNPPNPWDINDSFVAAGLKLANHGAILGTFDAEWKAAMVYFAGNNWNNPFYRFYGDSVTDLAAVIQEQIDAIQGGN